MPRIWVDNVTVTGTERNNVQNSEFQFCYCYHNPRKLSEKSIKKKKIASSFACYI